MKSSIRVWVPRRRDEDWNEKPDGLVLYGTVSQVPNHSMPRASGAF